MIYIRQVADERRASGIAPCRMCQVGDGKSELNDYGGRYWYWHAACGFTMKAHAAQSVSGAEMYWNRANGRRRTDGCTRP